MTPNKCAKEQYHMTDEECTKFEAIVEQHKVLFDGELGLYPHEKFHLTLKEGAVPVNKKPYPVPYTRQEVFCRELKNLVKDRVLRPCGMTNWASHSKMG